MHSKALFSSAVACVALMLIAGLPVVTADTHHIVKGDRGPRASAETWTFVPEYNAFWWWHIVNSGLRSLVVDVYDVDGGSQNLLMHERIRFASYSSNEMDTGGVLVAKGRTYSVTMTPNGAHGSSCVADDEFTIIWPIVTVFSVDVYGLTVNVDASASYDPDGEIVAYAWDWGDGYTGSGVTASHTYLIMGMYTITLTTLDNDGLTNSSSLTVTVARDPFAVFVYSVSAWTVAVDASPSSADRGIVGYAWDWGDGTTGSGVMTTHTYTSPGIYPITLTVTDTIGHSCTVSHDAYIVPSMPPVAQFSATVVNGHTVLVDASASTSASGIAAYEWDFGSVVAYGVTHSHIYVGAGTYTITLKVTDVYGQSSSVSQTVTITTNMPPDSYWLTLYGMTYASDGMTLIEGSCTLSVTDVRTGETLIGVQSEGGSYLCDLTCLATNQGDMLIVKAIGPSGETGTTSAPVDYSLGFYMQIDVTLS